MKSPSLIFLRENVIRLENCPTKILKSKGRTYDDVLIYPVGSVQKWLSNHEQDLKEQTRSRFYVAVTRARYSVGIVLPDKEANQLNDIYQVWENTFE